MAQCLPQKGQHGPIALLLVQQILHIPEHPDQMSAMASLLQGAETAGRARALAAAEPMTTTPRAPSVLTPDQKASAWGA